MKTKQLPDGLDHWLKTRTIVIGGTKWFAAHGNTYARRLNEQKSKRSSFARTIHTLKGDLVPRFKFMPRSLACFSKPKSY